MKNMEKLALIPFLFLLLGTGCENKKGTSYWENAPVVAERVSLGDRGEMIALDPALLRDTITFPISYFMEEMEIVKLDGSDGALVDEAPLIISDNYILLKNSSQSQTPCKLFDKKGKFIGDVGKIGQGPGEYQNIYSMQIDETSKRIYLLPWMGDNLLVYDLDCQSLPPIRLPYRANKGIFKVEGDKVTVAVLPFPNIPTLAWTQTLEGEVLYEIPANHLHVAYDFSNEIESSQNTSDMDLSFWFWPTRIDSLYHIDTERGILLPKFTANFKEEDMEPHSYLEWPGYFVGNTKVIYTSSISDDAGNSATKNIGTKNEFYIVDKNSLKGAFLRIENDYWGGAVEEWPIFLFNRGYYARNMDPGNMEEWIDKTLKSKKLADPVRQKLTRIKESIGPDDNNYIVYAKMKR